MLTSCLKQLMKKDLSEEQFWSAIFEIIDGARPELISAFLVLLHNKPETTDKLYGSTLAMQKRMLLLHLQDPVFDIVGTGGDNENTINISTATDLMVTSTEIKVTKHSNRSISSRYSSADFLKDLGIPIKISPDNIQETLKK